MDHPEPNLETAPLNSPAAKISALNPMGYAPTVEQLGMAWWAKARRS